MTATALHDERAETNAELERDAFNAAFYELGLHLYWDSGTYRTLAADLNERERVRSYLKREQPHLLRAYDADFLTDAVLNAKQRCQRSLAANGTSAWSEPRCTERPWEEVGF